MSGARNLTVEDLRLSTGGKLPIRKQEFYEGAALHLLARTGRVDRIRYEAPLFLINEKIFVHLKYSTKGRSPWGFTFMPDEQRVLLEKGKSRTLVVGLICGADGIAVISLNDYLSIASAVENASRVSCYRQHGEHYEISGPNGRLSSKVAPSNWLKILDR